MPFIATKVNVEVSKEKERILTSKFGKAIEIIPGKSEKQLMLSFEDKCNMYFRGKDDSKLAFVEVKLFGHATNDAFDNLTDEISAIMAEELGIEHTYVKYEEIENWGKMHIK